MGASQDPAGWLGERCGDYELEQEIASGGMGVVFRARQIKLNRVVALKMLHAGRAAGTAFIRRFRTEAETVAKLDHPHIVPIYEIGEHEGRHFFSMKLVEGESLAEQIHHGAWSLDGPRRGARQREMALLMAKLARAVQYAHDRGVLHRDLKPSNVMVDDAGEPLLTDFGLAKVLDQTSEFTQTHAVMGTAAYMSPEQAAGKTRQITTSTDIYGLGTILYELLTGRPPFAGRDSLDTLKLVVEQEPIPPRQRNPHAHSDLATICLKCLEKRPDARYPTARELAEDLERWARDEPIRARPVPAWQRALKWMRRKPLKAALAAVIVLSVITLLTLTVMVRHAASQRETVRWLNSAEALFTSNLPIHGVAQLTQVLQRHPQHPLAAARLLGAVAQNPFPLVELKHSKPVSEIAFTPDGTRLVTGSEDGLARVWDARSGHIINAFNPGSGGIRSLTLNASGNRIALATAAGDAWMWTWQSGPPQEPLALGFPVTRLRFSPSGEDLLLLGEGRLLLTNLVRATGWSGLIPGFRAYEAIFDGSGSQVALSAYNERREPLIQIWDATSGMLRHDLKGHTGLVRSLAYNRDASCLITASADHTARLWDLTFSPPTNQVLQHNDAVIHAAFNVSGHQVATASDDATVGVWRVLDGSSIQLLPHAHPVSMVQFAGQDDTLIAATTDGAMLWMRRHVGWVPWAWAAAHEMFETNCFVDAILVSPDRTRFATRYAFRHDVHLWSFPGSPPPVLLDTGMPLQTAAPASDDNQRQPRVPDLNAAALSADGHRWVTSDDHGNLRLWSADIPPAPLTANIPAHANVWGAAFSQDGRFILAQSTDTIAWPVPPWVEEVPPWMPGLGAYLTGRAPGRGGALSAVRCETRHAWWTSLLESTEQPDRALAWLKQALHNKGEVQP